MRSSHSIGGSLKQPSIPFRGLGRHPGDRSLRYRHFQRLEDGVPDMGDEISSDPNRHAPLDRKRSNNLLSRQGEAPGEVARVFLPVHDRSPRFPPSVRRADLSRPPDFYLAATALAESEEEPAADGPKVLALSGALLLVAHGDSGDFISMMIPPFRDAHRSFVLGAVDVAGASRSLSFVPTPVSNPPDAVAALSAFLSKAFLPVVARLAWPVESASLEVLSDPDYHIGC